MKENFYFLLGIIYFTMVSVPLAVLVFSVLNLVILIKFLCKKITMR
jgi:hypothetical protein